MLHVKTKLMAMALSAVIVAGCSNSSANDTEMAQSLYNQADSAFMAGNYVAAKELLDSIDGAYAAQIETRRKGMVLMSRVREGLTMRELEHTDSLLAVTLVRNDSITSTLKRVNNDVEPYFIVVGQGDIRPGSLTARMSPDGDLYIISCVKSGPLHTSVSVSVGGEQASTVSVAPDGEQNDRSGGLETIHYLGAECDSVAKVVARHADEPVTVSFNGRKTITVTLSRERASSIASLYNLSKGIREIKALTLKKEGLEKQLELTRQQLARTAE